MARSKLQLLYSLAKLRTFKMFLVGIFLAWSPIPAKSANLIELPDSVANLEKGEPGLEKIESQVRDIYTRYIRSGQLPKTLGLTADKKPYISPIKVVSDSVRLVIEFGHKIDAGDSMALECVNENETNFATGQAVFLA